MTLFIETEATPNPNALKFRPGQTVSDMPIDFADATAAKAVSQFASNLFEIEGVARVHLGADFISVTKTDDMDWGDIKPSVLAAVMDQALSGLPYIEGTSPVSTTTSDNPIIQEILDVLDERVRPAVAMDGGDVVFDRFEDGVVYLHMRGACAGCPSSTATLKSGIESLLKHFVPQVQAVEQTL